MISFSRMERRSGGGEMTYRQLTAAAVIQWLKRIWNWFVKNQRWLWRFSSTHSRGSFKILPMTFLLLGKDGTPRNTQQPVGWKDQICKYGSTNMQCQLLVIILMMMKAVKILIQFNRYCLSFLCQKQQSTTYHFFELFKSILTVLLDVPEISN